MGTEHAALPAGDVEMVGMGKRLESDGGIVSDLLGADVSGQEIKLLKPHVPHIVLYVDTNSVPVLFEQVETLALTIVCSQMLCCPTLTLPPFVADLALLTLTFRSLESSTIDTRALCCSCRDKQAPSPRGDLDP